jgi:hypothetical protein
MADLGAGNWNESDSGNNTAAPDGAPEGMTPSGVNDVLRAVMGAQKRFYNWQSTKQTAGSATAYTLNYGVAPGALVDGMTHLVEFHTANGVAATLNVNSLGAKPLHYYSAGAWRAVPAALFDASQVSQVAYNASAGAYRLLDVTGDTGEVKPFAGAAAPAGYLLAFGQAISRTDYAGLFAVCGTTFGAGNGSTTFNLPDLRGRVAAGKGNMGGVDANRLTGATALGNGFGGETNGGAMDGPNLGVIVEGSAVTQPTVVAHQSHIHGNVYVVQPTFILNLMIRI